MNSFISEKKTGSYEGKDVMEYTLRNAGGMQVSIINYGATITKIIAPDKHGNFQNLVIGFDDLESYLQRSNQYIGCIVGRYCNRIANGRFTLDEKTYQLAKNNGNNSLHGGEKGFDKALWNVVKYETNNSLQLSYLSKDGEEGFPGNLNTTVVYCLDDNNALSIDYTATTDQPTPLNLTNHCYFNLSGKENNSILDHRLQLSCDHYTVADTNLIPTGKISTVENSSLDFRSAKKIGSVIDAGGYDHNLIINKNNGSSLAPAAILSDPTSGRVMEMFTTEPAVQFYSAKFFNEQTNKEEYTAVCLEAQHYPNSPNEPSFPNTILRPGEIYRQTTVYKFLVK